MGRTIVISDSEKHPIPAGVARKGEEKSAIIVFGLHNDRGENVVYSTRVTDKFFDVLNKYDLVSYRGDQEFRERVSGYRQFIRPDVVADFVGVAYHIRKIWTGEKYLKFVCEMADAIGEDQSKEGKPVDPVVKSKGEDPAAGSTIPGVNANEPPPPPTMLDNPPA